jgi:hypothetical protein
MPSDESLAQASEVLQRREGLIELRRRECGGISRHVQHFISQADARRPPCFYPYMHLSSQGFCDDENAQQGQLHGADH